MCDYSHLTKSIFSALADIKTGRYVYVVARRPQTTDDIDIEDVIASKSSCPQEALNEHCQAEGLDLTNRLAIPVVLPAGLKQEDAKGFKAVRQGASLHIEFTQ